MDEKLKPNPQEVARAGWVVEHRELIFSGCAGLLLLAGWLAGRTDAPRGLSLGLLLGAYAAGGFYTLREAVESLRKRQFDIDTLMLVAAAGAGALGAWEEGALLLFLFSLGHALEHIAMDRARKAIEALAELAPKTAVVQRNGLEMEVRVEELLRGDRVVVKPGQRIPADGQVDSGTSGVNQAPVTGESMPVDKQPGDKVFAGTVNGEGVLVVEVGNSMIHLEAQFPEVPFTWVEFENGGHGVFVMTRAELVQYQAHFAIYKS